MADPRVVHVEVNGQRYPIRSALDPVYVQELAAYVDRKMRVAFDSAPSHPHHRAMRGASRRKRGPSHLTLFFVPSSYLRAFVLNPLSSSAH